MSRKKPLPSDGKRGFRKKKSPFQAIHRRGIQACEPVSPPHWNAWFSGLYAFRRRVLMFRQRQDWAEFGEGERAAKGSTAVSGRLEMTAATRSPLTIPNEVIALATCRTWEVNSPLVTLWRWIQPSLHAYKPPLQDSSDAVNLGKIQLDPGKEGGRWEQTLFDLQNGARVSLGFQFPQRLS